ncbi:two pore domain potassium channel family protein [Candidatus Gracilibacteria bacterium]|nr:two pore domain potassium channel family protein [Candidatus Gracilibacteria bacterium]
MLHIHHRKLLIIAIIFLLSWLIGTFFIHRFEAGHPIGESYFDAFYFTVITTATIGFGDLVPITTAGKIVTMLYAIFYVPLFLYTMNILFQSRFDRIRIDDEKLEREMHDVEADVIAIMDNEAIKPKPHRRITKK